MSINGGVLTILLVGLCVASNAANSTEINSVTNSASHAGLYTANNTVNHIANSEADEVIKSNVDYIHYQAALTPSFSDQSVTGNVSIKFKALTNNVQTLTFSAKYKSISAVKVEGVAADFSVKDDKLIIQLEQALKQNELYLLNVEYRAAPKRGMKFYDDHLFTVYHTQNWLVAHNNIDDKATFELLLTHKDEYVSIGNGELLSQNRRENNNLVSHWSINTPIPIYTFGFAVGDFATVSAASNANDVAVLYRDTNELTANMVEDAFKDVPDMVQFFENKAGFKLPKSSYRYVVVDGYMAQEATGFSLVGEKFVHTLQKDKHENWFIAHEIAHEWWGNSITCSNFSHFWLNEGLVQFLVAAYKQHLFGEKAYEKEIGVAVSRVNRAVDKGRNGPVAYRHQIDEKEINRTMAYSKGALVFHLLRKELGDTLFWQALKQYSLENRQQSVTTVDLKTAFEKVSKRNLTPFFDQWVYGDAVPKIRF